MIRKIQKIIAKSPRAVFAMLLVFAIVGISGRVASAETPAIPAPERLGAKMLPPTAAEGAFDTPFFDALEEPLTLSSFEGQGLVVNFWATWCAPCVEEMPSLESLAKKLEGSGVRVLAISEDRNAQKKVPIFFAKTGIQNLELHYDVRGAVSRKFGVHGLPTTLLIDADGREIGRVAGVTQWDADENVEYFRKALAKAPK